MCRQFCAKSRIKRKIGRGKTSVRAGTWPIRSDMKKAAERPPLFVIKRVDSLFPCFGLFTCIFPTGDAGREMLDVRITELLGGLRCGLVSRALGIAAICHYQSIFVLRQNVRELLFVCLEI